MLQAHNALLHVYASHAQVDKAKQLYSSMQERGPAVDNVSAGTLIAAYAKACHLLFHKQESFPAQQLPELACMLASSKTFADSCLAPFHCRLLSLQSLVLPSTSNHLQLAAISSTHDQSQSNRASLHHML